MSDRRDPLPLHDDPALMVQVLARRLASLQLADVDRAGVGDVRESDGYVFQHLLPGPLPVGDLAARLGITQQGASKAVVDLERRGLVRRRTDPADRRVRRVELTEHALRAVDAARASRMAFARAVEEELGARRSAALRRDLARLVDSTGAARTVEERDVQAPS